MQCPYCSTPNTQVRESRPSVGAVRRRRDCPSCKQRFTTYERVEELPLAVVKRDGREEPFDREKLLRGLARAAVKRPIKMEQLDGIIDLIEADARQSGGRLTAEEVGELALRSLVDVDQVAYVRFASVYRAFKDTAEFEAELQRLAQKPSLRGSTHRQVSESATDNEKVTVKV